MVSVGAGAQIAPAVAPPSGKYRLDMDHSSIFWSVRHLGLSNYTARFIGFSAALDFDAAKPERSAIAVSVDPRSIRTEYPHRERTNFDDELATSANWFDAGKYPEVTFRSTGITRSGSDKAVVAGVLTLRGVSKSVTLNATFNGSIPSHPFTKKPVIGFSGTVKFKRSDFGMTYYIPMVGDEVTLHIETEFVPVTPPVAK